MSSYRTSHLRNSASRAAHIALAILFAACLTPLCARAQQDSSLFSGMQWRQIGPFRAGRVSAVAGVAGNPAVYYIGTPGGGVWRTTDGGMVWKPISDDVHVASIGAIVVAPSNPQIIYFGTGDVSEVGGSVNQGNGVYKSGNYASLLSAIDGADGPPTKSMKSASEDYCKDLATVVTQWEDLRTKDLPAVNSQLTARNLAPVPAPASFPKPICPQPPKARTASPQKP